MIRCKCGTWTEFGLTCVNCRQDAYRNLTKPPVDDLEDLPPSVEDDDEILDDED